MLRNFFKYTNNLITKALKKENKIMGLNRTGQQDLNIYWEQEMAQILETWGEGNVWNEIQFLLVNCRGRVLDIACGTGKTMEIISKFPEIEAYGCDISDFLIQKAVQRGISDDRLVVCDASKTNFPEDYFEHAYSIGSLEHFTENGINDFLSECSRIVKKSSFHMIPVSRSGRNEGWIKTYQSFHNNSIDWWLSKYQAVFKSVCVLDSIWQDEISIGKWFVCAKDEGGK